MAKRKARADGAKLDVWLMANDAGDYGKETPGGVSGTGFGQATPYVAEKIGELEGFVHDAVHFRGRQGLELLRAEPPAHDEDRAPIAVRGAHALDDLDAAEARHVHVEHQ